MMWMAELACLSPPLLSLCRQVMPDDTGIGATPQSIANAASDLSLSGLSPTVTISWAADCGPTQLHLTSSGAASARMASIISSSSDTSSSRST